MKVVMKMLIGLNNIKKSNKIYNHVEETTTLLNKYYRGIRKFFELSLVLYISSFQAKNQPVVQIIDQRTVDYSSNLVMKEMFLTLEAQP